MLTILKRAAVVLAAGMMGLMTGCGGGGGGTSSPVTTTTVAGTAAKGILYPGSISIYAVDAAGVKAATPLKTVLTDTSGQFSADVGVYSGTILIEATGTYTDEASGASVVIDTSRPMRAVIDSVSGSVARRFAVTPLTDLAYSLAGTLTAANVAAANVRVSGLFKVSDITAIEPVQANAAVLGGATLEQQTYTLALAALSQMAKTSSGGAAAAFSQIATLLSSFAADLSLSATAGLGSGNTAAFAAALATATSGSLSGFTSAIANLAGAGMTSLKLTLAISSPAAGTSIGAVQGTIAFPAGTSVRVVPGTAGEVVAGLFTTLGAASSSLGSASFVAPTFTFGVINASGFGAGDFATVIVDVASGAPTAASFTVGNVKVVDINGTTLTGVTVTLK